MNWTKTDWLVVIALIVVGLGVPIFLAETGYRHSTANDIKAVEERLVVIEQKLDKLLLAK